MYPGLETEQMAQAIRVAWQRPNQRTLVRLLVVCNSRQYNVVINKALFVLNYSKLEIFKDKRRAVLGMGDYRQFITNIKSCVRLGHLYKKAPHIFRIKLELQ